MAKWRLIGGVVLLGYVAFMAFVFELDFASVPLGIVQVTVVREEGRFEPQALGKSPTFTYAVSLPGGSQAHFTSTRRHRPGEALLVAASRGRLTGRVWLGSWYQSAPPAKPSQ